MDKIVLTRNSEMPELRTMTRKQAKEFNKAGLNPMRNVDMIKRFEKKDESEEKWTVDDALFSLNFNDEMAEWILASIYPEYDFDNADQRASDALAAETYTKTFLSGAEAKNS